MDAGARCAIAYVAGRLLSERSSSSIYDYSRSGHRSFSGRIGAERVNVFDHGRRCHVSGRPASLYDYGRSCHVQLKLQDGGRFKGYDYGSSRHFSGKVSGRRVSLYDYETSRHYDYQL